MAKGSSPGADSPDCGIQAAVGLYNPEFVHCGVQAAVGLYNPEFVLICNEDNGAYLNGVVKIRANLYEACSTSPSTKEQCAKDVHSYTHTHTHYGKLTPVNSCQFLSGWAIVQISQKNQFQDSGRGGATQMTGET